MPLEGQAERVRTPLDRRDRRALAVVAAVSALAILAGVVYAVTRGGVPTGARCFTATYPSSVGGATVHRCGAAAAHYCRVDAGVPQVATACRRAGFAVGAG